MAYEFDGTLAQWTDRDGEPGSWYFVPLPFDVADEIEARATPGPGFGSVRVEATIGGTTWRTSLFPSKEDRTYVLPVKKPVRAAEGLDEGGDCRIRLVPL